MSKKKFDFNSVEGKVEMIGPDQAVAMLQGKNRPVSKINLTRISSDMANKQFKFNGEPIIVSDTEELLDGQHRLLSIIETRVTLPFYVIRGIPVEAFASMGRTKPRRTADVMAMDGHKNYNQLASLAKFVFLYDKRKLDARFGSGAKKDCSLVASVDECREAIAKYPEMDEAVSRSASLRHRNSVFRGFSVAPAFMWLAYLRSPSEDGRRFIEQLETKIGWTQTSPSYALQRIISHFGGNGRSTADSVAVIAVTIKAYDAALNGRPVQVLRFAPNEAFPYLIDLGGDNEKR